MLPPHLNFIRKAIVCLHSFIPICADRVTVGMVIKMDAVAQFQQEKEEDIHAMTQDPDTKRLAKQFQDHVSRYKYGYYFTWMGRPIIQIPQDMISLQEVIMSVRPDLIIETGIAHGGSLIFSASMLELLDTFDGAQNIKREVVGIDIDIRTHNRAAIEVHPMHKRITMLEGSSIDAGIAEQVCQIAERHQTVMVLLDSCHTHAHVLEELKLYAPLVSQNSYVVVYDTGIEFADHTYSDRPWGKGNNPYTAVQAFLKNCDDFIVDDSFEQKSVLTSCPGGWLKRIK